MNPRIFVIILGGITTVSTASCCHFNSMSRIPCYRGGWVPGMFVTSYSLIAYTFRENRDFVFIIIVQFMMGANNRIRFGSQIVFVCLYITPTLYHHCANLSEDIEYIKCLSDIFWTEMGQLNTYNPIYCNENKKVIDRTSSMLNTPPQDTLQTFICIQCLWVVLHSDDNGRQ